VNAYAGVMGSCCLVTNFLAVPIHHTEGLSKRGYGQNSTFQAIKHCRLGSNHAHKYICGWKLQFIEHGLHGTDFFLSIENYFDHVAPGSVGDIQICQDVDGHHNFLPDCDVHLVSKSRTFLTILPLPCLGFGCNCEFLF